MAILSYLSFLNPLKWGSRGLEIVLILGVVGLVLVSWYRGSQLDEAEQELAVAEQAIQGATAVQERQQADQALGNMLTSGLVNDWLQQRETNQQVRVDLVDAYLAAESESPPSDNTNASHPTPDQDKDSHDTTTPAPRDDRDKLDALADGLRELTCSATQHVDRPNCPAQ